MPRQNRLGRLIAGAVVASFGAAGVIAACGGTPSYGETPIKLVLPTPPGSANDVLARVLADQIGRTQKRTFVTEYRPGAGTIIGTEFVAHAAADGHILLVNSPPAFTIVPHLRKLNFDPLTSLDPICELATFPTVIVVSASSPYHTLADFLDASRRTPGTATLAGIGPGSLVQVAFEMLKRDVHSDMVFVPYPGPAGAVNALLGNQVTSYFGNYTDVSAHIASGQLRALAVATPERIASLPGVPTVAESIHKSYAVNGWFGLFAPAKTPSATGGQIGDWFKQAMQDNEVREKLQAAGLYPANSCGANFAALIHRQSDLYGQVIQERHITLN
ncbi:MAG: tripartite tricarboxylate transporter substrate binding protein [Xanthobacteraceae bacterium]